VGSVLGVADLAQFIAREGATAEIVRLSCQTPTVELAAQAVGTTPDGIVKSLLFLVDGRPVVAIACGTARIDTRRIASHFRVGRKRVQLADSQTVLEATGYAVGALPPFGHTSRLPTLIDRQVLRRQEVYAGGGGMDTLLRVAPTEIVRLTQADCTDLIGPGSLDAA
jgi:prolyl-tRNA editing enzyme YbaK/EbsC (Cys-tRNA(Pro) deacylase)